MDQEITIAHFDSTDFTRFGKRLAQETRLLSSTFSDCT
jgi:hypothetical protein